MKRPMMCSDGSFERAAILGRHAPHVANIMAWQAGYDAAIQEHFIDPKYAEWLNALHNDFWLPGGICSHCGAYSTDCASECPRCLSVMARKNVYSRIKLGTNQSPQIWVADHTLGSAVQFRKGGRFELKRQDDAWLLDFYATDSTCEPMMFSIFELAKTLHEAIVLANEHINKLETAMERIDG